MRHWYDRGSSWTCEECGGAAVTVAVIRQHAAPALANAIWNGAHESGAQSMRRCPGCSRSMKVFEVEDASGVTELEGCVGCQFFWFDAGELERLGIVMKEPAHARVDEAIVDLELEAVRERGRAEALVGTVRGLCRALLRAFILWLWWP